MVNSDNFNSANNNFVNANTDGNWNENDNTIPSRVADF